MTTGIDSPVDCTLTAVAIAENHTFVGRFYRNSASKWAKLTEAEVLTLRQVNLKVVALCESASNPASYFSFHAGVDDGTSACRQALMAGQSPNTPIYFAVDFDASTDCVSGCVSDYFESVAAGYQTISGNSPAYLIGAYVSGSTCRYLLMHDLASYGWLAVSPGWSGYDTFLQWNIKQGWPDK